MSSHKHRRAAALAATTCAVVTVGLAAAGSPANASVFRSPAGASAVQGGSSVHPAAWRLEGVYTPKQLCQEKGQDYVFSGQASDWMCLAANVAGYWNLYLR